MPDPSCNPYLAFGVMLASGLDGIKNRIDPGEPVDRNIFEMSEREKRRLRIDQLPANLSEALDNLEKDDGRQGRARRAHPDALPGGQARRVGRVHLAGPALGGREVPRDLLSRPMTFRINYKARGDSGLIFLAGRRTRLRNDGRSFQAVPGASRPGRRSSSTPRWARSSSGATRTRALPLWSARALLDDPELVWTIHGDEVAAGAEILTANTFRTHARTLGEGGPRGALRRADGPGGPARAPGRGGAGARGLRRRVALAARGLLPARPRPGRRGARARARGAGPVPGRGGRRPDPRRDAQHDPRGARRRSRRRRRPGCRSSSRS